MCRSACLPDTLDGTTDQFELYGFVLVFVKAHAVRVRQVFVYFEWSRRLEGAQRPGPGGGFRAHGAKVISRSRIIFEKRGSQAALVRFAGDLL